MTDKNHNEPFEREETIRDLDVPERQAEDVTGGAVIDAILKITEFKAEPKGPARPGSS